MRPSRRLWLVMLVVPVVLALGVAAPALATADTVAIGPVFTAMNTSETLPDGVYFRKGPNSADTDRVTGHGVYAGEQVRFRCYRWGEPVGEYGSRLWYDVVSVSRPVNAGVSNEGLLNAHFIDDGQNANVVDAGVPECGDSSEGDSNPLAPAQTSVFFSGTSDENGGTGQQVADVTFPSDVLFPAPTCSMPIVIKLPDTTTTLAGWSGGRLGVIYSLKWPTVAQRVRQVVLIDPGNSEDFAGCDSGQDTNTLLANWLRSNNANRLLVLTGLCSEEKEVIDVPVHRFGVSTFGGLRKYYFAEIGRQKLGSQALVCDYNSADHAQIMKDAWGVVRFPPSGCPVLSNEDSPVAWHP